MSPFTVQPVGRGGGTGTVYIVGAGPGDPGLITVRGLALLQTADALVHDRLVASELLAEAPAGCERYDVGKAPGDAGPRQDEINALLVRLATAGKRVVRLKGGDPFVFGRGAEEVEACLASGVRCEVVPGVTSAAAVPAYAGIPLTHRSVASSVALVTGHEAGSGRVDWERLATAADTIVVLMPLRRLPEIVAQLVAHGRSPDTPAALISQGTLPGQRVLVARLADLAARATAEGMASPALVVVGEVVRLRERLARAARPLLGRVVLLPRTRSHPSVIAARFRELGACVVELPTFGPEGEPPAWRGLGVPVDVIVLASSGCARGMAAVLGDRPDLRAARLVCIGPRTAAAARAAGLRVDGVAEPPTAEGVVAEVLRLVGFGGEASATAWT